MDVAGHAERIATEGYTILEDVVEPAFVDALVADISRPAPFVFFAVMTVVQFVVVLLTFPETAGITLEDMQEKMESR